MPSESVSKVSVESKGKASAVSNAPSPSSSVSVVLQIPSVSVSKHAVPPPPPHAAKNKNPITSKKYPNIFIYLREIDAGEGGTFETRILRLQSKTNKKFPKFILRKEGVFDKFRSDIDYRNNPEFSKKFFLKSLEKNRNKIEVEKLFDNFSLQKKLISNPINIESNGNEIFYYWDGVKFRIEELPKRISEVQFLHDNFFDS